MAELLKAKKKYIFEFIGTFLLVFLGTGIIVLNDILRGNIGRLGIVIAFGFIVALIVYLLGPVSGAHINPAVSVGFYIVGMLPKQDLLPYIFNQSIGAILASALLHILVPSNKTLGSTTPVILPWSAFRVEMLLSFILMLLVLYVVKVFKKKLFPIAVIIGAYITVIAFIFGPITGASMNPARSLGPALVSGVMNPLWIYLAAPVAGSAIAGLVYRFLCGRLLSVKQMNS